MSDWKLVDIGVHIFRIEINLFQPWAKIVAFNMFGKLPSPNDMLHIFVIVSARFGTSRLMSHVGAGSNMQCFGGDAPTIFKISSAVAGREPDRARDCLGSITCGLALDVGRRILLHDLILEKVCKFIWRKFTVRCRIGLIEKHADF